ncbi:hypothetical protein ACKWTF_003600 [Chironomus riparius]
MLLTPSKTIDKFNSPTLFQLQCGDNPKVKILSSKYEENIAKYTDKALRNRLTVETPLSSRKLIPSFEKNNEQQNSDLLDLFQTILTKDKEYTDWMKKIIDSYIYELEFEARFMAEDERKALITSVFGNVKSIYEMHIKDFQPFIEACVNDKTSDVTIQILNFAKKLASLCKNGTFYPYILHSTIEKESILKRNNFYTHLMTYAEQKYQFPYSFDPISQMTHYGLIIDEIFKEVHKQKVSLKCIEKMTYAVKEFKNQMAKIKAAGID